MEYWREVSNNQGKFITDNDPIGISTSEKLLSLCKSYLSMSNLEEGSNYRVIEGDVGMKCEVNNDDII